MLLGYKRNHWKRKDRWEKEITKHREKPRTEYGGHLFKPEMHLDKDGYQKGKTENGENFEEKKLGAKGGIMTTDAKLGASPWGEASPWGNCLGINPQTTEPNI